ncbi:MAG: uridine diphosphate-N-acetylglucosamine-binding protein YvcK [Acidobacteria bacterium]|nr:uridine diphosphate-N-acetylglucosamine-binding protein YvcK [Acidobacteriota bacterium]
MPGASDPGEQTAGVSSTPLRVVAIGGGTGLSTLLRGLRKHVAFPDWPATEPCYISDLAAVVTVTDDGGSSGRLRQDFNMLPPGDIRNCMIALSAEEDLLSKLFAYRFKSGAGLDGHSFGNLFITALSEITGDFAHAVQLASKILATRGRIYPATPSYATVVAHMEDGSVVRGETNITASKLRIAELMLDPPNVAAMPETLEAIHRADLITVGPGSLYTSLITNLLVQGIPSALASAAGVRVFVCNLMTQANESLGLTASEHIERIYEHTRAPIFDYAIVNTAKFSPETLSRYAAENASPIEADIERIEHLGVRCIAGDFASEDSVVRHAANRVTGALLALGNSRSPNSL